MWFIGRSPSNFAINHAPQIWVVKKLCQHVVCDQANECVQHLGSKRRQSDNSLPQAKSTPILEGWGGGPHKAATLFRHKPVLNRGLQEKLSCVVQRLAKLRTGFDGRTESLWSGERKACGRAITDQVTISGLWAALKASERYHHLSSASNIRNQRLAIFEHFWPRAHWNLLFYHMFWCFDINLRLLVQRSSVAQLWPQHFV